jgi:hypothetical protein
MDRGLHASTPICMGGNRVVRRFDRDDLGFERMGDRSFV